MTTLPKASITLPAASAPVWPCSSTTRVDATFRVSLSMVVARITVGKTEKSSGRLAETLTRMTISASTILKVNKISSSTGGSGRMIIARITSRNSGVANLWRRISATNRFRKFMKVLPPQIESTPPAGEMGLGSGRAQYGMLSAAVCS